VKAILQFGLAAAIFAIVCCFLSPEAYSAGADRQKDETDDATLPFYEDLSGDGTIDTLHTLWNGKRVVVIDEGGNFLQQWQKSARDPANALTQAFSAGADPPVVWNPVRANWGSYLLLADNDGDGEFGGTADFYYRVVDINKDGSPELEYFCASKVVETVVNLNGERDFKLLNFAAFAYGNEHRYAEGGKYYQNIHGSGFFLNTRIHWGDVSLAWETPIAWYDFNHDGFTDMVMRIADEGYPTHDLQGQSGRVHEAEFAFELNGELGRDKWHSLDCQLTYTAYWTPGLPLTNYVDDINALPAPAYARKFFGSGWEQMGRESRRFYLPYLDGYKIATDFEEWVGAWWIWDEDDDDNRWEEMFARNEKYSDVKIFSDKLGDRVEFDTAVSLGLNTNEKTEECAAAPLLSKEEKTVMMDVRVLRGYASLTDAAGLREKYHRGYWLKDKVMMDLLDAVEPERRASIQKLFYTGRIPALCRMLLLRG
jgi:hypothetical protein